MNKWSKNKRQVGKKEKEKEKEKKERKREKKLSTKQRKSVRQFADRGWRTREGERVANLFSLPCAPGMGNNLAVKVRYGVDNSDH